MKLLKRIFTALLILLAFNLYLPSITFAEQDLTKHKPEILSTPEEDIPTIKEKKKSGWSWVLAIALIAGLAAAAGGGGGGDDDGGGGGGTGGGGGDGTGGDTGDVTVTW